MAINQPGNYWAADTKISMPVPPEDPVLFDMGGFGLTINGIVHNINKAELEDYQNATFAPSDVVKNG